jgi:hypothetical protein
MTAMKSAPHVQHFAENITHTLESQCKKRFTTVKND